MSFLYLIYIFSVFISFFPPYYNSMLIFRIVISFIIFLFILFDYEEEKNLRVNRNKETFKPYIDEDDDELLHEVDYDRSVINLNNIDLEKH